MDNSEILKAVLNLPHSTGQLVALVKLAIDGVKMDQMPTDIQTVSSNAAC